MKKLLVIALGLACATTALADSSGVSVAPSSGNFSSDDFVNGILGGGSSAPVSRSAPAEPAPSARPKFRGIVVKQPQLEPPPPQPDYQTASVSNEPPPMQEQPQASAGDCPAQKRGIAVSIQFGVNSYDIQPDGYRVLEQIAQAMNTDKLSACNFMVEGHTDASGDANYNRMLSKKRAQAVRNFLAYNGVAMGRLQVEGKGESEPLDPRNPYADVNRRVQFMVGY